MIVDESSLIIFNKSFILSTDYTGQGVDQLQKVIDTIKANPEDRRIILCAWNAKGDTSASSSDLVLMSFCRFKLKCSRPQTCPSWLCHPVTLCVSSMCATVSCPVSCTSARVIWASGCPSISPVMHFLRTWSLTSRDLRWGQRASSNLFFFILVLHRLIFHVDFDPSCQPGDFVHTLGDAHIYINHIEPLKVQVGQLKSIHWSPPLPLNVKQTHTHLSTFSASEGDPPFPQAEDPEKRGEDWWFPCRGLWDLRLQPSPCHQDADGCVKKCWQYSNFYE